VEREGVVIELDQLRAAHRAELLIFVGEEVEFVVHGNIPGGVVDGVESECGIHIVPHGAPPMEILSCRNRSFARIFVRQFEPEFYFGKKHGTAKDTEEAKKTRSRANALQLNKRDGDVRSLPGGQG
jgi:hypothetical protein